VHLLAYQTGVLYRDFVDAPRAELASVFDAHGFRAAAGRLRDVDMHRALSSIATRVGSRRKDGLRVVPLAHRGADHILSFQIEQVSQAHEFATGVAGARLISSATGILVASPIAGVDSAPCMRFAERLRDRALRLVSHADARAVSRAVNSMAGEARAFRFISRGAFILSATDPTARRVVACFRELREKFYDETRRTGLRASVIEIYDHGENGRAVTDAIVDDAERQVETFIKNLETDEETGVMRRATLEKRVRDTRALVRSLRELGEVLGRHAGALVDAAGDVLSAYEAMLRQDVEEELGQCRSR